MDDKRDTTSIQFTYKFMYIKIANDYTKKTNATESPCKLGISCEL